MCVCLSIYIYIYRYRYRYRYIITYIYIRIYILFHILQIQYCIIMCVYIYKPNMTIFPYDTPLLSPTRQVTMHWAPGPYCSGDQSLGPSHGFPATVQPAPPQPTCAARKSWRVLRVAEKVSVDLNIKFMQTSYLCRISFISMLYVEIFLLAQTLHRNH